jgi:hypothetical protein
VRRILDLGLIAVFSLLYFGCGVKGDPVPPGTPAELGRGQPTYKKATEEFAFPDVPPIYDDKKNEKEE